MGYSPFSRVSPLARASSRFNQNQTGSTLLKGTPVKLTSSGIDLIDVSIEADVDALAGVLNENATSGTDGTIVSSGTIENISTAFAVGSVVYISKTGILTNVKPSIGLNGFGMNDAVIKVGMIAKNNTNPANKDLLVNLQVIGIL